MGNTQTMEELKQIRQCLDGMLVGGPDKAAALANYLDKDIRYVEVVARDKSLLVHDVPKTIHMITKITPCTPQSDVKIIVKTNTGKVVDEYTVADLSCVNLNNVLYRYTLEFGSDVRDITYTGCIMPEHCCQNMFNNRACYKLGIMAETGRRQYCYTEVVAQSVGTFRVPRYMDAITEFSISDPPKEDYAVEIEIYYWMGCLFRKKITVPGGTREFKMLDVPLKLYTEISDGCEILIRAPTEKLTMMGYFLPCEQRRTGPTINDADELARYGKPALLEEVDYDPTKAMTAAAEAGNLEIVKYLCAKGFGFKNTDLIAARDHPGVVEYLKAEFLCV